MLHRDHFRSGPPQGVPVQEKAFIISELASRWGCTRERVVLLIEAGLLRATLLPNVLTIRRKYVIQPEWVAEFERGRDLDEHVRLAKQEQERKRGAGENARRKAPRYF